jgi:SAM-dependent methyltransferase
MSDRTSSLSEPPRETGELTCEEGCGCRFSQANAYVASIDGADRWFCCSDCADTYAGRVSTPTAEVLRTHVVTGQTVADLGCGSGYYASLVSDFVGPAGRVHAVDSRPERLQQLEARIAHRAGGGEVQVHVAPTNQLPFLPDESVDFVLSNNVLCCRNERRSAIPEMLRILKPGGLVYIRAALRPSENVRPIETGEWEALLSPFVRIRGGEDSESRWALLRKTSNPRTRAGQGIGSHDAGEER